jgi:hypothetical protein
LLANGGFFLVACISRLAAIFGGETALLGHA